MLMLRVSEEVDGYLEETGYVTFDPHRVVYHGDSEWIERLLNRAGDRDGTPLAKARHVARTVVGSDARVELADPPGGSFDDLEETPDDFENSPSGAVAGEV